MARILIAYSTRYGSTRHIAETVGAELTAAGFDVDVLRPNPDLEVGKYDAVVAGSPIYGGKWLPSVSVFFVANAAALAERPVAMFSAGMIGVKNPKLAMREHDTLVRELQELAPGVSPVSAALFNGSFSRSQLPLCLRIMDMMAGTPQGDRRDWSAIRGWAQRVGERFRERLEGGQESALPNVDTDKPES